jgi:hypothetical protein
MYAEFRNVLFVRFGIRSEHTQLLSRLKISVPTHTPIRLFLACAPHPFHSVKPKRLLGNLCCVKKAEKRLFSTMYLY